jgi:hypothetical protein
MVMQLAGCSSEEDSFFVALCLIYTLLSFLTPSLHNLNVVTYFEPCSIILFVALNGYSVWQRIFFLCMYGSVLSQHLRSEDTVCNLSLLTTVMCVFELSLDCDGTAIKNYYIFVGHN